MKCENTKFAKEKVKIAVLSQGYSWNKNGVTFGTKWYGKIKIAVCNLGFSKMYLKKIKIRKRERLSEKGANKM